MHPNERNIRFRMRLRSNSMVLVIALLLFTPFFLPPPARAEKPILTIDTGGHTTVIRV